MCIYIYIYIYNSLPVTEVEVRPEGACAAGALLMLTNIEIQFSLAFKLTS